MSSNERNVDPVGRQGIFGTLFFLSGASSLIYQVIWTRQLELVFGATTFASATVLSAFMGGLALGSILAGRLADRLRQPLLSYGCLEGFIGLWALLTPFLFQAAVPIYKYVWLQTHFSLLPFSLLRFFVLALILLPPTSCMGATLPLLARLTTDKIAVVGSRVGMLYSLNSCGAVLGAVLAGFVLIPALGLSATTLSAAAINILLAFFVIMLCRRWRALNLESKADQDKNALQAADNQQLTKPIVIVMVAFGLSGLVAMVNEVAWTRALLMVIGSTTYAFAIMLSAFLSGIFAGSLFAARLVDRLKDPLSWFAVLQLLLCAAQILSIHLFNQLPYWNLIANWHYQNNANAGMYIRFLLACLILFPITFCLGAAFPLAVTICSKSLNFVGKSVGTLYAINTMGAIIGAFLAGFAIVPLFGAQTALLYCALANCLIGTGVMLTCLEKRRVLKFAALLMLCGMAAWLSQKPEIWDRKWITLSQTMRRDLRGAGQFAQSSYDECRAIVDKNEKLLYFHDGACSNVAVMEENGFNSLYTNGHVDASTSLDIQTQALLPALPLLLSDKPTDVATVGWGSGATAGYSLLFPVKKVVCAELESAVLDTSKYFHKINFSPEYDPRLSVQINDGRNYLLATDETFDVIASEPSNPWQEGVCNLFTREFFQICHDRLKPGGKFSMWCQYVELSQEDLARVFSALKSVYKHAIVFFTGTDIVVLASDEAIKINLAQIDAVLTKNPRLREALSQSTGIKSAVDLAARIAIADDGLDLIIREKPPVTDDQNFLEFDVAKNYEQHQFADVNTAWMSKNAGKLWDTIDWSGLPEQEQAETMNRIAESSLSSNAAVALRWAQQSAIHANSHALQIIAMLEANAGHFQRALAAATEAVTLFPHDQKARCMRGLVFLMDGQPMRARLDFAAALSSPSSASKEEAVYKFRLAETYLSCHHPWYLMNTNPAKDLAAADNDPVKVISLLSPLINGDHSLASEQPLVLAFLAAAKMQIGDTANGIRLMRLYLELRPEDKYAARLLAEAEAKAYSHK